MHVRETIGEIILTPKSKIIVSIIDFGNKDKIDFRVWFVNKEGQITPTKKGVTFEPQFLDRVLEVLGNCK